MWKRAARMTLDLAAELPDVATVNLGGGFKVGRMPEEPTVDLDEVAAHVRSELEGFRERDGRALHLEIEPGTYWPRRRAWSWRPASTWSTPGRTGTSLRSLTPA